MIRVAFVAHLARDRPGAVAAEPGALTVALCRANASVNVAPGLVTVWWPLAGSASVLSSEGVVRFDRRAICVCESQREQALLVDARSAALGIIGAPAAFSELARLANPMHADGPALFPAVHAADLAIRRSLVALLRNMQTDGRGGSSQQVARLVDVMRRLQRAFVPLIDRCPGSTAARRKIVFLRLQRVRNHIENSDRQEHDVRQLAQMANYSVWRFIKLFKIVFGETPYAFVSRCRIDRAQRLLQATTLSIADVAEAVGFGSRANFVRAFARHGGVRGEARAAAAARLDCA